MLPTYQNNNPSRLLQKIIFPSTINHVLALLHLRSYLPNIILRSAFNHLCAPLHLTSSLQDTTLSSINQSMRQHQPHRWYQRLRGQLLHHSSSEQPHLLGVCKKTPTQQSNNRAFYRFHLQGKGSGKRIRERASMSSTSECLIWTHGLRDFQAFL
jgi:hypothetical protein